MKRPALVITLIIAVIVGLSVVQAVVANQLSTTGIQLDKIQSQITQLKKDNQLIHEKILTLSSLNHVASKAAELGFVPQKGQVYLSTPLPIALNK